MANSNDSPRTLATAVAVQDGRIDRMEKLLYGNGKPGLEERIFGYMATAKKELREEIKATSRHDARNMEEGDTLVLRELTREREERERQHLENKAAQGAAFNAQEKVIGALTSEMKAIGKKTDRNTNVVLAVGLAFTILTALKDFGIIHVIGAK